MFLGVMAWERIYPKYPVYYGRRIEHDSFFGGKDPVDLDLSKYPIVIDATGSEALWVLSKNYLYLLRQFITKKGFSLETRRGDTIRYDNIDLKYMAPSDGWLLRWERAPEEKCRVAFAPLVNSTVTPEEAKPVFIDKPKSP